MGHKTPRIRNKKARRDYHILETIEAGLVLEGSARVEGGEVRLYNMHIGPFQQAGQFGHDPRRTRKLLLKKREIDRFLGKAIEKGHTLVPLALYFRRGWAKVELAVARGKREFDKREDIKKRDHQRQIERELARRQRRR